MSNRIKPHSDSESTQLDIFSSILPGVFPDGHSHEGERYSPGYGAGHEGRPTKFSRHVGVALIIILLFYGFLLWNGYPQQWTQTLNAPVETKLVETFDTDAIGNDGEDGAGKTLRPPFWMVIPFAVLLLCVAFFSLIPATAHWWENNLNKLWVGSSLGLLALLYYYYLCDFPVNQYWPGKTVVDPEIDGRFAVVQAVFINAIIYEFLPFIVLLFALFVITGGIRVSSSLKATPLVNTVILTIGALLASFIGTTGAAVLLIRPLLDMNRHRHHKVHTIIFFIFTVCNCGGCLTPLGDPPLFLGYLRGVPFEWPLLALWPMWLFINVVLLTMYFIWDHYWSYPKECPSFKNKKREPNEKVFAISGWLLNVPLLLGVIMAIAFLDPGRPILGTDWHPWFFLRETVQLGLAAVSLLFSCLLIRKENVFNFLAIGEVAALFFGIFLCMQAPLQILGAEGKDAVDRAQKQTGVPRETLFFWATGTLSLVLDNAPTYVVFFEAGKVLHPVTEAELAAELTENGSPKWERVNGQWKSTIDRSKLVPVRNGFIDHYLLIAVALGTVFMGAMTYIANAPNFLVKAIAEHDGVPMPSFFGYMGYSCLFLLPVIIVMMLIFIAR